MVRFAVKGDSLQVSHNGRQFTPLDVLGLSSVGLSTKSQQGKRTIGFMGVGFKAVYKRYAKVCIEDGMYSFSYQEPTPHKGGYGWVMLPVWKQSQGGSQETLCHFSLERPRGGMQSILRDLSTLPTTAPPLLGRAALVKMEENSASKKWTLNWNGKLHVVERTCLQQYTNNDSSEVVTVIITDRQGLQSQSKWLFVSHKYMPSPSARTTYLQATKRSHAGAEEVCAFINLAAPPKSGRVHSVLPTKISLPTSMHVQGSWLLSVDRQEVQDLSDNSWNSDILKALPYLSVDFFRWAANEKLEDYTKIMGTLPMPGRQNADITEILGQSISLRGLQQAFYTQKILPVAIPPSKDAMDTMCSNNKNTDYCEGERSMWVPPSFLKWLKPGLLLDWLGKMPLRTDLMGDAAYHPIFSSCVIGQLDPLPNRRLHLCKELLGRQREPDIQTILQMMAAISDAYDEHPDYTTTSQQPEQKGKKIAKKNGGNNTTSIESKTNAPRPSLPSSINAWPVFLTESGSLVTVDHIALPDEDFALVPQDLAELLRPYILKKEEPQQQYMHRTFQKKRDKKNGNRGQPMKSKPTLQRLHPSLQEAIIRVERSSTVTGNPETSRAEEGAVTSSVDWDQLCGPASSFLKRARSYVPSNVVDVPSAVSNLFDYYSKQGRDGLTNQCKTTVLSITQFALEMDNHRLVSFVLIDDVESSGTKLIPAAQAYVGKSLDDDGPGSDLQNVAGKSLPYISLEYNAIIRDSSTMRKKLWKLFSHAGVQTGLSVDISAVGDVEQDRTILAEDIIPHLPEKKLPQLRKNPTKNDISLPYGLGKVMNRRKYTSIDAQLSNEWERLVNSMSPESAVGFISLLLALPVEANAHVTAKSVPAAAKCLSGQVETQARMIIEGCSGNHLTVRIAPDTAVPLRKRLYFLPPGQPGAKALDISEAQIVKQLTKAKWLPCSAQSDFMSLALFRPDEALLKPDMSRPEMPVVRIPEYLLMRLQSSALAQALTWGTHSPPPPVMDLVKLTKEATYLLSSCGDSSRIEQIAAQMISLWTAIARAHLRGELSSSDMRTIKSLGKNSNRCIPVRRVLESRGNGSWIVAIQRCVRMPEALYHNAMNSTDELKELTLASLVDSNFMCDFNHSKHNPFFLSPDISKTIIYLVGIQTLSEFQTSSLISVSGLFVRHCCRLEPDVSSRVLPIRASFSYAMRYCIESPSELDKVDGGLKVWVCNTSGSGSKTLRRRWVSLKNGPVQVVLDDSRARRALLTPEMGIQVLGVLNHSEKDCPNAKILSQIDKEIVKYCGIWRLSDSRFVVKTRTQGSGVVIKGASSKIQLVCALLKSMEVDRIRLNENSDAIGQPSEIQNDFLTLSYEPPIIIRHDSLIREFRGPAMSTPVLTPIYALKKKGIILVCGDSSDFSLELEELILNLVGVLPGRSSETKSYRAAIRLLSHLEIDSSFTKFVNRDFADSEVTQRWKYLIERKRTFDSLHRAEKAKDTKALRSVLITAEEMCEDDLDGGDAALQSARALLAALEAREEARQREEHLVQRRRTFDGLQRAEKAKDAKALRSFLITAEELCEDDLDGGDAALQSARELLIALEAKEETRQREVLLRKLKDAEVAKDKILLRNTLILAEELCEESVLQSARDLLSCLEKGAISNSLDDALSSGNNIVSFGRGRGVGRTLPAWMKSGNGPNAATDVLTSDCKTEFEGKASGRGRGISNRPAWMMHSAGNDKLIGGDEIAPTTINPVKSEEEIDPCRLPAPVSSNAPPTGVDPWRPQPPNHNASCESNGLIHGQKSTNGGPEPEVEPALSSLGNITTDISQVSTSLSHGTGRGRGISNLPAWLGPTNEPGQQAGVGRGRGTSNLPAWMTNPSSDGSLKRMHSESLVEKAEEERPMKKVCDEITTSEYTLKLSIKSARESDFVEWLKAKIEEEAKRQGGSATLLNSMSKTG